MNQSFTVIGPLELVHEICTPDQPIRVRAMDQAMRGPTNQVRPALNVAFPALQLVPAIPIQLVLAIPIQLVPAIQGCPRRGPPHQDLPARTKALPVPYGQRTHLAEEQYMIPTRPED